MSTGEVAINYLNSTNYMFLGGLIMAIAVEHSGLHNRVALRIIKLVRIQYYEIGKIFLELGFWMGFSHLYSPFFNQQRMVFTNSTLFYQQHIILPTTHYFTNSTLFYQQRIVLPAAHCFTNSTLFYQQQVVLPTLIVLPTAHCFTNSTLFYQQHIVLPTAHYITNSTLFYQQHIILPTTTFDANFNSYSNIACINFMRTILGWDEPS